MDDFLASLAAIAIFVTLGCAESGDDPGAGRGRLPSVLAELTLVRDSDEITAVEFPHARHNDTRFVGREMACVECHHTLADLPESIPVACGTCHHDEEDASPAPDI